MPRCFICGVNSSLDRLEEHFKNYHRYGYNQSYKCIEPSCSGSFNNFGLIQSHYVTEHRLSRVLPVNRQLPHNQSNVAHISIVKVRKLLKEKLLNAVMTMYGSMNISRQEVQHFFDIMKDIIISNLNIINDELQTVHGHDRNTSKIRADVLLLFKEFTSSFDDFQTESRRLNKIDKSGYFIIPIEYSIGKKANTKRRDVDGNLVTATIDHTACFFPLSHTLKKFFELPSVYDIVIKYKESLENEKNLVTNFIQSEL